MGKREAADQGLESDNSSLEGWRIFPEPKDQRREQTFL
jgi:hypothetical protein